MSIKAVMDEIKPIVLDKKGWTFSNNREILHPLASAVLKLSNVRNFTHNVFMEWSSTIAKIFTFILKLRSSAGSFAKTRFDYPDKSYGYAIFIILRLSNLRCDELNTTIDIFVFFYALKNWINTFNIQMQPLVFDLRSFVFKEKSAHFHCLAVSIHYVCDAITCFQERFYWTFFWRKKFVDWELDRSWELGSLFWKDSSLFIKTIHTNLHLLASSAYQVSVPRK